MRRSADKLILIVGSNPLPNMLALRMLGARDVRFVYTRATEPVKQRLQNVTGVVGIDRPLSSSSTAALIRGCLTQEDKQGSHLHYTGGTKAMAVHIHHAWSGSSKDASYLADDLDSLVFDDGYRDPLDVEVSVPDLAALHGVELRQPRAAATTALLAAARVIAHAVCARPALAVELYARVSPQGSDSDERALRDAPFGAGHELGGALIDLPEPVIPGPGWTRQQLKPWWRLLRGDWLEELVAVWMRAAASPPLTALTTGLKGTLGGRLFEIDVVGMRNHRLFVVSCTTDGDPSMCKLKLFEATVRARQLGGDLARSALVSLLPPDGVAQVQGDVRETWGALNTPRVFGLANLREWVGRPESRLHAMGDWLNG